MNLLIDMNLAPRWIAYLSENGHEAVHWSSVGAATAQDEQICDYARERGFVVVTNGLDFPRILACTGAAGPSVVLCGGYPRTPEVRGPALLLLLANWKDALERGVILTVDWAGRPRARLLPLR